MTDQAGSTPTPPGWYPDPGNPGHSRYWDGSLWAPSDAQVAAQAAPASAARTGTRRAGVWSEPLVVILALVLLFPLGLFLMWRGRLWTRQVRWIVTAAMAVLVVIVGVQSPTPSPPVGAAVVGAPLSSPAPSTSAQPSGVSTPQVTGSTEAGAAAALAARGLTLGSIIRVHSAQPAGTVLAQSPAAGLLIAPGSVVALVVSSGPLPAATATPSKPAPSNTTTPGRTPTPQPSPVSVSCSASMSNSHPTQNSTVYVLVRTGAGAGVTATAHYKTTDTTHSSTASSSGQASIAFRISHATHQFTVLVSVSVSQGGRTGSCSTSFTTQ